MLDKNKLKMEQFKSDSQTTSGELSTTLKSLNLERQKSQDFQEKLSAAERVLERTKDGAEDKEGEYQAKVG